MSKYKGTETKNKCGVCNKTSGCDNWLACEVCDGWFHAKCVSISEEEYKILNDIDSFHCFCSSCNVKVGKVIPNLVKLSDRIEEVNGRLNTLESDMKTHNDKNNDNLITMKADLIKIKYVRI